MQWPCGQEQGHDTDAVPQRSPQLYPWVVDVTLLVMAARKGDDNAFRRLLEIHRDAVTSTLYACGIRCTDTAHDLAQDTAIRAWTKLDRLSDPSAFSPWIRRIAANAARDHLRRLAVRREEVLDETLGLASGENPHDLAEQEAETRLMLAALEREDQETLSLLSARANGVPIAALAVEVGIAEAAMKMRLMRIRKRLRRRLEELRHGR
jgi:RNA polymerase sigma-70 factor (ECF subfamily)